MITSETIESSTIIALYVPKPLKQGISSTRYKLIQYDPCSMYFVTIDYNGHDGEYVIKNIQINKEIKIGND